MENAMNDDNVIILMSNVSSVEEYTRKWKLDCPTAKIAPPSEDEVSSDKDESRQQEGRTVQHNPLPCGGWTMNKTE